MANYYCYDVDGDNQYLDSMNILGHSSPNDDDHDDDDVVGDCFFYGAFENTVIDEVLDEMDYFTNAEVEEAEDNAPAAPTMAEAIASSSRSPFSSELDPSVTVVEDMDSSNSTSNSSESSESSLTASQYYDMNSSSRSSSSSSTSSSLSSYDCHYYHESNDGNRVVSQTSASAAMRSSSRSFVVMEAAMVKLDECMRRTAETRKLIEQTAAVDALLSRQGQVLGGRKMGLRTSSVSVTVSANSASSHCPSSKRFKRIPVQAAAADFRTSCIINKNNKKAINKKPGRPSSMTLSKTTKKTSTIPTRKSKQSIKKTTDMLMSASMGINLKHIQSLLLDCPPPSSSSSRYAVGEKAITTKPSPPADVPPGSSAPRGSVSDFLRNHKMQQHQKGFLRL